MKLSKDQINALAKEVYNNQVKDRQTEIDNLKSNPEVIAHATHAFELYQQIPQVYLNRLMGTKDLNFFISQQVNDLLKDKRYPNVSDISHRITIETIEAADLAELKAKLGINF